MTDLIVLDNGQGLRQDEAVLEFTYEGEQGTVNQPVAFDLTDEVLIRIAQEALRSGEVTGITQDANADLDGYKVDRFAATQGLPNRVSLRPKTPFGDSYDDGLARDPESPQLRWTHSPEQEADRLVTTNGLVMKERCPDAASTATLRWPSLQFFGRLNAEILDRVRRIIERTPRQA